MIDCSTLNLLNCIGGESYEGSCSGQFQPLSYRQAERLWSYAGKITSLTRALLNMAGRTDQIISLVGTKVVDGMMTLAARLKLFSIVSVPFSLLDVTAIGQKIKDSFWLGDGEGVAMGSVTLVVITIDIVDSVMTFINAALITGGSEGIELFNSLGLPFGFTMSGLGSIVRIVQIAKAYNLYSSVDSAFFPNINDLNKENFKEKLERILGFEAEIPSERDPLNGAEEEFEIARKNKAIMAREIPKQGWVLLESLFALLGSEGERLSKEQAEVAKGYLEAIQQHLEKKIEMDVIGLIVNAFLLSALVLFSVGSVTALPFLLLSVAFVIKILALVYQESELVPTLSLS